jgi:hypothetical protein
MRVWQTVLQSILALILVTANASEAQTPKPLRLTPLSDVSVYDSRGKRVGRVMYNFGDQGMSVPFRLGNWTVFLIVTENSIEGGDPDVYFDQPDCLGNPFITPRSAYPNYTPTIVGVDATIYVPIGNPQTVTSVAIKSIWRASGCGAAVPDDYQLVPATRGPNLAGMFSPPFSVR